MADADSPAIQRIFKVLADAFLEVGEKVRQDLIEAYRKGAEANHKALLDASADPANAGEIYNPYSRLFTEWHYYTDYDKNAAYAEWESRHPAPTRKDYQSLPPDHITSWEQVRGFARYMSVSYRFSDSRANEAYESARDGFVLKNTKKIGNVLGKRNDLVDATVRFRWRNGVFEGSLVVTLSDASFSADVGLKYVVRYIPRTTPYFQYPLLFKVATVQGAVHRGPSEEELRILLGGRPAADVAAADAEAAVAEGWCPMGGQPIEVARGRSCPRYIKCPACGADVSTTTFSYSCKFKKHRTPVSKKSSAEAKLETAGYCKMSREEVPAHVIQGMGPVDSYKDPKALCEQCGQKVRLDSRRDWIRKSESEHPTQMLVTSARYYKHRRP